MQSKDSLIIAVFTLITVLAWIVFDVYHVAVTSTVTEVQQKLLTPLDPKINAQVLANIKSRTYR